MPEISIIVPVYNVAPYLRECMDSLIGQTFQNIEIICIDDGSTDDSPRILAEYASADTRVRVLRQPNSGQATARNAGLAVATAPFIMFCDSDDWYAFSMCEKMHAAMQGGVDMAVCGGQVVTEMGQITSGPYFKLLGHGDVAVNDDMLMNLGSCLWNKIYCRSVLEHGQIQFPDGLYFEDNYFIAAYTAYVHRVASIPDKLYYYRLRNNSTMGRVVCGNAEYTGDHVQIANCIWQYHEEHKLVLQRLSYLVDIWLELCGVALDLGKTPEECANLENEMISFAMSHIIPCNGLKNIARQRLQLLMEHRWIGLHRHMGDHVLSRCKERVTPKGYMIKRKYYWMGVLIWRCRKMLSVNKDD